MLTPTYLTITPSEECPRADHTLFEQFLYIFSLFHQVRTHGFEGISLPRPLLSGKAIKLPFPTSLKTLSPGFNLALVLEKQSLGHQNQPYV